jgi:asparagine synthase (glutamine-hydrolysing)
LPFEPPIEKCYPYLDRSLQEFLYAIPREQLVRPGQRRSLMRRALAGIVPDEVLNRKRKAYVARAPLAAISTEYFTLLELSRGMISGLLGIVEPHGFMECLRASLRGQGAPIIPILRTVAVEAWLRNLQDHRILAGTNEYTESPVAKLPPTVTSAEKA